MLVILGEEKTEVQFCSYLRDDGEAAFEVEFPIGLAQSDIDTKMGELECAEAFDFEWGERGGVQGGAETQGGFEETRGGGDG